MPVVAVALLLFHSPLEAKERLVTAIGSCAVVGMTAEQCQHLALQRARAAAIEEATGVRISSSSVVTNGSLAADFIRSYSRGFIVKEERRWLPLAQYQADASRPPVPEYGVEITAMVLVPDAVPPSLGLDARLNKQVFASGEKARLTLSTTRPACIAVFNITADDRAVMLFPCGGPCLTGPGGSLTLPQADSGLELEMQTLPGHKSDAEGFLVAALPEDRPERWNDFFDQGAAMDLPSFFARYAKMADHAEDMILAYEVVGGN